MNIDLEVEPSPVPDREDEPSQPVLTERRSGHRNRIGRGIGGSMTRGNLTGSLRIGSMVWSRTRRRSGQWRSRIW